MSSKRAHHRALAVYLGALIIFS